MWVEFQSSEESCARRLICVAFIFSFAASANNYSFLLYLCVLVAVVIKRVQFIYIAPLTNRNFLLLHVVGLAACRSSRKCSNGADSGEPVAVRINITLASFFANHNHSLHWFITKPKQVCKISRVSEIRYQD